MATVTVTGAAVGKDAITLFLADGMPKQLSQNDWKTSEIMEIVGPALAASKPVDIDLDVFSNAKKVEALTGQKVSEDAAGGVFIHQGRHVIAADTLAQHIDRAAVDGAKGLKNFLTKFEGIKRRYTKDELLKFLKDADLPFMDDGSILGFKILNDAANPGYMVDKHTGKVLQKLGSLVYMPESKVDQSRALCSTGLHIAARRYLSGFWYGGKSKLCLVRIQPKDVVSVPEYETSKMRVSAYHIIKVFTDEDAQKIVNGTDIHDLPGALRMLEEAVGGVIPPILERVECRGYGEITVTPILVTDPATRKQLKRAGKVSKVSPKKVRIVNPVHLNILKRLAKLGRPVEKWTPAYSKKVAEAQLLLDKGALSLREIAKKLGVDRDSMTANLDRRPRRVKFT